MNSRNWFKWRKSSKIMPCRSSLLHREEGKHSELTRAGDNGLVLWKFLFNTFNAHLRSHTLNRQSNSLNDLKQFLPITHLKPFQNVQGEKGRCGMGKKGLSERRISMGVVIHRLIVVVVRARWRKKQVAGRMTFFWVEWKIISWKGNPRVSKNQVVSFPP